MYWNSVSNRMWSLSTPSLTETYDVLKFTNPFINLIFMLCLTETYDVLKCNLYKKTCKSTWSLTETYDVLAFNKI